MCNINTCYLLAPGRFWWSSLPCSCSCYSCCYFVSQDLVLQHVQAKCISKIIRIDWKNWNKTDCKKGLRRTRNSLEGLERTWNYLKWLEMTECLCPKEAYTSKNYWAGTNYKNWYSNPSNIWIFDTLFVKNVCCCCC